MPIHPYLEGRAFDPETIDIMAKALRAACDALGLKDKDDAAVRILTIRILEQVDDGIRDPDLLKSAALR